MTTLVYRGRAYEPSKIKKAHKETLDRVSGFKYRGESYHYEKKEEVLWIIYQKSESVLRDKYAFMKHKLLHPQDQIIKSLLN